MKNFRLSHNINLFQGTATQAIKSMAFSIGKRRHRIERQYGMDFAKKITNLTSHITSLIVVLS